MSLVDSFMKEFLLKRGIKVPERKEVESRIPENLRITPEIRYEFIKWALAKFMGKNYKRIIDAIPNADDLLDKMQEITFFETIDEIMTSPDVKPALDFFSTLSKNSNPDAATFENVLILFDYIIGNYDEPTLKSPKRLVGVNKYCAFWEYAKIAGIPVDCGQLCFDGLQRLARIINPKFKVTGKRDGALIGAPNISFNTCRTLGDDTCSAELVLED